MREMHFRSARYTYISRKIRADSIYTLRVAEYVCTYTLCEKNLKFTRVRVVKMRIKSFKKFLFTFYNLIKVYSRHFSAINAFEIIPSFIM